jgi:glycosyltransferase involved in cell wall biosynthesis
MLSRQNDEAPSLIVIGLPRSLTSLTYQWSARALALRRPSWTTDGELLNADRFTFAPSSERAAAAQHFLSGADGGAYDACLEFARTVIQPRGHAYKIVTQPSIVNAMVAGGDLASLRFLRIVRNLPDVALALIQRGWMYPSRLDGDDSSPEGLLRGLLRAQRLLREVPAIEVHYDDIVWRPKVLGDKLQALYPELTVEEGSPHLLQGEGFERARDEILARRETEEYRQLQELLSRIEGTAIMEAARSAVVEVSSRPRLLAVGDAVAPTGFGRVMEAILRAAAPHFDVHQVGLKYGGGAHTLPWRVIPSTDHNGPERLVQAASQLKPDVVFMLNDIWVLAEYVRALRSIELDRARLVAYCPVDGDPVRPEHLAGLRGVHRLVTFTHFGHGELDRAARWIGDAATWGSIGIEPHGVDTDVFHPLHSLGEDWIQARRTARQQLFVHDRSLDDAFIVLNANRNQPRKRVDLTMMGFAEFARGKDDVRLYLHMGTQDHGWKVRELADRLDIASSVLISVDTRFQPCLPLDALNLVYNACDVGLNTSTCEGWGLVSFEHAATGAAQIVGNHTASGALWSGHAEMLEPHLTLVSPTLGCREYYASPRAICDRLTALYEDRELLLQRSRQAYELVTREEFRWSTIGSRWRQHFSDELGRR